MTVARLSMEAGGLNERNLFMATGNIWLLEKYGFLHSDEFNGLLLAYVET